MVKFTNKVKRGLVLVRTLTLNALGPDAAPGYTTVRKWTRAMEHDLNAALAWMEQVEDELAERDRAAAALPSAPPEVVAELDRLIAGGAA